MGTANELKVVERWLAAANRRIGESANRRNGAVLEELSHPEVEIVGPRGAGYVPRAVLSEWLLRAGFSAESLRWFCGGNGTVVVEQAAAWHDVVSGVERKRRVIGSRFQISDGLVASYVRHEAGAAEAVSAAGLDLSRDLVPGGDVPPGCR